MFRIAFAAGTLLLAATASAEGIAPSAVSFDDGAVPMSLTGQPGNPEEGRKVFMNRKQGNCLACHANSDLEEQPFHGEVGPPLDGVGDRWSEAELRGILTNSKMMFPDTIMPAFYIDDGYIRPLEKFAGKPILTAQQVEDVIAYLMTLREQ